MSNTRRILQLKALSILLLAVGDSDVSERTGGPEHQNNDKKKGSIEGYRTITGKKKK